MIALKRIYEPAMPADGERILVERLWPRGVSKEQAHLSVWEQDLAPSAELRQWYNHDVQRWPEFRVRYELELEAAQKAGTLNELAAKARKGRVTLVFAAKDPEHSSAKVLKEFLEARLDA